ncbi:uncharacterized protein LOC116243872 [Phasianus colchicus]|uniref:uncharacterized protein LOC116243872 n=1 Tax=Phasianus colchicus TaxID=9054 RepID=UPI00129DA4DE|nr:uncharacterized protein LOC116243872 [Phasianus colchicus]
MARRRAHPARRAAREPRPCSAPRRLGGAPANPGAGAEAGGAVERRGRAPRGGGVRSERLCLLGLVPRRCCRLSLRCRPSLLFTLPWAPLSSRRLSTSAPRSTRAGSPARSTARSAGRVRPVLSLTSRGIAAPQAHGGIRPRCSCKPAVRSPQRDGAPRGGSALLLGCTFTGTHLCCPLQVRNSKLQIALGINEGLLGALLKPAVTASAALPLPGPAVRPAEMSPCAAECRKAPRPSREKL